MARDKIVIIGAGGFGREVAWLIDEVNQDEERYDFVGFVDDSSRATPEGYSILGTTDQFLREGNPEMLVSCGIGDPLTRRSIVRRFLDKNFKFATLIHPTVRASRWIKVGSGSIICAGNILTTNVTIGDHVILNLDCTVGHDAILGDYSSVMPGVHLSGDVKLGEGTYLGTGAAVINSVSVGSWTTIGAGAVVASDLPEGVIAVGVPAKPIKPNPRRPANAE